MLPKTKPMIFATVFVAIYLQSAFSQSTLKSARETILVEQMDDSEFAEFSNSRDLLVRSKQYPETRIRLMSPERAMRAGAFLRIDHPRGSEILARGNWQFDQSRRDWKSIIPYFRFVPEVTDISLWDEKRRAEERQNGLENEAVDEDFLIALQGFPHLRSLQLVGGRYSRRAIELISKLPIARLSFGRCSFEDPTLSSIQGMNSLEEVLFQSGLKAEAFIGLSKLPRFNSLYIGSIYSQDFEAPISAQVQQAIRSLDGQFESFFVEDYSSPVHPSIVQALLDVHSLSLLRFDSIAPGLTIDDVRKLRNLNQLEKISFGIPPGFKAEDRDEAERIVSEVEKVAEQRRLERLNSERMLNVNVSSEVRTDR